MKKKIIYIGTVSQLKRNLAIIKLRYSRYTLLEFLNN